MSCKALRLQLFSSVQLMEMYKGTLFSWSLLAEYCKQTKYCRQVTQPHRKDFNCTGCVYVVLIFFICQAIFLYAPFIASIVRVSHIRTNSLYDECKIPY